MKAPVGLLSDRTVLRSKMEGLCPDKFQFVWLSFERGEILFSKGFFYLYGYSQTTGQSEELSVIAMMSSFCTVMNLMCYFLILAVTRLDMYRFTKQTGRTSFDKKLKKQRFTSNLHQLMQKSVQARKNRIISAMSGQFQSELPIFKTNRNTNRDLSVKSP